MRLRFSEQQDTARKTVQKINTRTFVRTARCRAKSRSEQVVAVVIKLD